MSLFYIHVPFLYQKLGECCRMYPTLYEKKNE